jgi:cytoplasmic iron level regulating protein YaaA (DUF328/UPF0246 family)
MDLSGDPDHGVMSQPVVRDTCELLEVCRTLSAKDLQSLMGVSSAIAEKDFRRYQEWDANPRKAACLAMDGLAYRGFDGESLSPKERSVAQEKVRILSGLYGVLRPYDAIRPYRLEMGSKLRTSRGSTLYQFWGSVIAEHLSKDANLIVNAASQEYWKAVSLEALGVPVVTVAFPGPAVYAKKARGLICRYAVQHDCKSAEDLRSFVGVPGDSYAFDGAASTSVKLVFRRLATAPGPAKSVALKRPAASVEQEERKRAREN